MTIEFRCEHCGKALSTTDDKAGRRAKCPGCGEPVLVPEPAMATLGETDDDAFAPRPDVPKIICPMCGSKNRADARACDSCGEPLRSGGGEDRSPQRIEAGDVLSSAWRIYKQEMGLVIGGVIVAGMVNIAIVLPQWVLGIVAGIMQQQGEGETAMLLHTLSWCLMPVVYFGQWYIGCGLNLMLLKISRGDPATVGDIFSGGKYVWRMAGTTILYMLMVFVGTLCLIIPGIILSLMFLPYGFVLVDEDPPGIQALGRAKTYTNGNLGTLFVLCLAAFGINMLGTCAMFVGLVFTVPLTALLFAVAYGKMSGQHTAA